MRIVLMIPLALIAACTQTPAETARAAQTAAATQDALAKEFAGLVPGKPLSCISQFRNQSMKAYGATIVYRVSGDLKYRSETGGGCGRIGAGDVLVTKTPTGQLCSGDIAQTFDAVARIPTGSCAFGEFVPYRKPS